MAVKNVRKKKRAFLCCESTCKPIGNAKKKLPHHAFFALLDWTTGVEDRSDTDDHGTLYRKWLKVRNL